MTYTREQIKTMDAEQLSEATAIHVMGWTKNNSENELFNCWLDGEGNWKYDCHDADGSRWNPAEDTNATMEITKRLTELGFKTGIYITAEMVIVNISTVKGLHVCEISGVENVSKYISRASLLAVLDL